MQLNTPVPLVVPSQLPLAKIAPAVANMQLRDHDIRSAIGQRTKKKLENMKCVNLLIGHSNPKILIGQM